MSDVKTSNNTKINTNAKFYNYAKTDTNAKIDNDAKTNIDATIHNDAKTNTNATISIDMKISIDKPIFDFPHTPSKISVDTTLVRAQHENGKMESIKRSPNSTIEFGYSQRTMNGEVEC